MENNTRERRPNILTPLNFIRRHANDFRAIRRLDEVKVLLMRANHELGKLSCRDRVYNRRVQEFNQAMIDLSKGKWYAARAMESSSSYHWKLAFDCIRQSKHLAQYLLDALLAGVSTPIPFEKTALATEGTEILFAHGVPLIPEIQPVVILQGSDYDMGYQYAQQVIHIFGRWIFKRKAGQQFTAEELHILGEWERQIRQYAPEILRMCEGWAAGATDAGIHLTYGDVLALWTGCVPPAHSYMGMGAGLPTQLPGPACSGVAAWGRATVDGRLVVGASGDHDPTHSVTIIAFPETGNNFIYTPFSVTGDVREIGPTWMMGHPGMNNKGLAYVEHGGEVRMIEPREGWGYGIRRGAAIFHILRFANNAHEALELEMSYPVGDVGRPMGSVGGFYADRHYGYVLESRHGPTLVREAGGLGETDFLYANNNALHPGASKAEWMQTHREHWSWDEHGGWYPTEFGAYSLTKMLTSGADERLTSALSQMYENSRQRNRYCFDMLKQAVGQINAEYIKMLYRQSGSFPPGNWDAITANYQRTGQWGDYSIGHASNALVAVMQPDNGDTGTYALCVGTAARGVTANLPTRACPIYGETNAFWEVTLASSPMGVAVAARQKAHEYINAACNALVQLLTEDPAYTPLKNLLSLAQRDFEIGLNYEDGAKITAGHDQVYHWGRAVRAFTRAQVRALQVEQALVPPPNQPHLELVRSEV
jgi:hypothetical protein